jgi:hypothetical protein
MKNIRLTREYYRLYDITSHYYLSRWLFKLRKEVFGRWHGYFIRIFGNEFGIQRFKNLKVQS